MIGQLLLPLHQPILNLRALIPPVILLQLVLLLHNPTDSTAGLERPIDSFENSSTCFW